jgi:hypothetical protein
MKHHFPFEQFDIPGYDTLLALLLAVEVLVTADIIADHSIVVPNPHISLSPVIVVKKSFTTSDSISDIYVRLSSGDLTRPLQAY